MYRKTQSFHHGWWWPLALQSPLTRMSTCAYKKQAHTYTQKVQATVPSVGDIGGTNHTEMYNIIPSNCQKDLIDMASWKNLGVVSPNHTWNLCLQFRHISQSFQMNLSNGPWFIDSNPYSLDNNLSKHYSVVRIEFKKISGKTNGEFSFITHPSNILIGWHNIGWLRIMTFSWKIL